MGQISLSGSMTGGPQPTSGGFPTAQTIISLALLTEPKSSGVATGVLSRNVAVTSPTWLVLQGVGPTDTVTHGDTLYVRCTSALLFRLTVDDGSGGDVVLDAVPLQGLMLVEFNANLFLKKLEVQGTGQIEYFVSGQS